MSFLKSIFSKKDEPVKSYDDFWNWFQRNEKSFYKVVKEKGNIEKDFFDNLSQKLNELRESFFYLAGMYDDNTAELVLTAEGRIKNIVFVEELVAAAPSINGWKFTALKPALDVHDVNIEMAGYKFNSENLSFYSAEFSEYPDEIDIIIVHPNFTEENQNTITNGVYIFLDNYLGELNFVTTIDNLTVIGKGKTEKDLIPIGKLKEFLIWREKEFIEKYDGVRYDTENDGFSRLEAEQENGKLLKAVINRELLEWDSKASHPWVLNIEIKYDGENNGMPNAATYELLDEIEDKLIEELRDFDGYLNIGRQTANNVREIYFACKEFRNCSKVMQNMQVDYMDRIYISYDIFKDKYWRSFNRFAKN